MIAPGAHHNGILASELLKPLIILRPDGVSGSSQGPWVGGAKRKQIGDGDAAMAPLLGKRDAATNGWVVLRLISG